MPPVNKEFAVMIKVGTCKTHMLATKTNQCWTLRRHHELIEISHVALFVSEYWKPVACYAIARS
jgi:hypothetical protein